MKDIQENEPDYKIYDCVIVGAGPAGLTAALYGKRGNLDLAIIEKDSPGGKIVRTGKIENYPGFVEIDGPDLAWKFYEQVLKLNIPLLTGTVYKIKNISTLHKVVYYKNDLEKKEIHTKTIIIATGLNEKKIGIPGEDEFYGHGVSYCAVCDAVFFKNEPVAVIGGGNTALEEAMYLTKYNPKIYLIHRRDQYRAAKILVTRLNHHQDVIEEKLSFIPLAINGNLNNMKINSILVKNIKTNEEELLNVSAVFPFIGLEPNSSFLKNSNIDLDLKNNFIQVNQKMETNHVGIYAVGDIINNKTLHQIVNAASDGAIAAQEVIKYLDNLSDKD
ncbi:NAD(P)/FAD-dependent oxidoreductase [Mycoplasma sp. SG1]|uniref:NAD(P)/FAD-dependent oxidoreductase n=1 Tax=Mycoplasma sp. SG1 TaxID=2810348 RepID=UPI0020246B00|nr:FAD-dependent oxidoreductase [Mycoplasma sp. SG1]URM53003.1 FAD-dependent oxidoreductase [Mycoplasma sp. SG1]